MKARRLTWLLAPLLAACGGGDGSSYVSVTVTSGVSLPVTSLDVIVTNAGRPSNTLHYSSGGSTISVSPQTTFGLKFDSTHSGGITVDVRAFGATGELAHGSGTGTLVPKGTAYVTVPLGGGLLDGGTDDTISMCNGNADCPLTAPKCTAKTCGPCGSDADCPTMFSRCDNGSGACVACLDKIDCAPSMQTCDVAAHSCVACRKHADCASGLCAQGKCIAVVDTLFVNNKGGTCTGTTHAGDKADPYCEIADAITHLSGQLAISVAASGTYYNKINLINWDIAIVGPGRNATPTARIVGITNTAVTISGNSHVILDGLEVNSSTYGIQCEAGSNVTITGCLIHEINMGTGVGVFGDMATVTIDANMIGPNNKGGNIAMYRSIYNITNNFLLGGSPSTGPNVFLDQSSTGSFRFNTVAHGYYTGMASGIDCSATGSTKVIESSIVYSNVQASGTQFAGKCSLVNVVTGPDSFPGAIVAIPDLVSASDLHLLSGTNNQACCIGKITAPDGGAAGLPDHDVDFQPRPGMSGAWDIGADQL